jgi:gluconokinase
VDRDVAIVGGATSEGGNVYAWCREMLKLPPDDEVERALAASVADGSGLTILPFLAGERAPGWRGGKRAVIAGLTLDVTPLDVVQSALEAVALRLALVYELLAPHAAPDHIVVASGGAITHSRAWTQILADALGRAIHCSPEREATSRGAALLAFEALGALPDATATRLPLGEILRPDAARHARYRVALEQHKRLDDRV